MANAKPVRAAKKEDEVEPVVDRKKVVLEEGQVANAMPIELRPSKYPVGAGKTVREDF